MKKEAGKTPLNRQGPITGGKRRRDRTIGRVDRARNGPRVEIEASLRARDAPANKSPSRVFADLVKSAWWREKERRRACVRLAIHLPRWEKIVEAEVEISRTDIRSPSSEAYRPAIFRGVDLQWNPRGLCGLLRHENLSLRRGRWRLSRENAVFPSNEGRLRTRNVNRILLIYSRLLLRLLTFVILAMIPSKPTRENFPPFRCVSK